MRYGIPIKTLRHVRIDGLQSVYGVLTWECKTRINLGAKLTNQWLRLAEQVAMSLQQQKSTIQFVSFFLCNVNLKVKLPSMKSQEFQSYRLLHTGLWALYAERFEIYEASRVGSKNLAQHHDKLNFLRHRWCCENDFLVVNGIGGMMWVVKGAVRHAQWERHIDVSHRDGLLIQRKPIRYQEIAVLSRYSMREEDSAMQPRQS